MKIKNISRKTSAKLLSAILATGIVASEAIITNQRMNVKESFKQVVKEFQDDTLLDEAEKENIAMYEDMKITEAADELTNRINLLDALENLKFNDSTLTEQEKKIANSLSIEEIMEIANKQNNNNNLSNENQEEYTKMLNYINIQNKKWLENNAKEITTETIIWSLKSALANELHINPEDIQDIKLPYLNDYKELVLCLRYDGEEYKISKKDVHILNALYLYYQVKLNSVKDDPDYSVCKTALNSAKALTMTGIKKDDNLLKNKRSLKEAHKILKK